MQKNPDILLNSTNPRELVGTGRLFAASAELDDQQVLFRALASPEFLRRLNTEQEYLVLRPTQLNAARIMRTLMDQPHRSAIATLVALTGAPAFQQLPPLVELNVLGLAADRPATDQTIAYWDLHSAPDSSLVDLVVEAIFINRSEPALNLFLKKLNDPSQDDMRREFWLKDQLLRWRNDPAVLTFCERILKGGLVDVTHQNQIVEVLYDYNEAWYRSCEVPSPPARIAASDEAKATMARIAQFALYQMELLIPGLAQKIRLAMAGIGYDLDEPGVDKA